MMKQLLRMMLATLCIPAFVARGDAQQGAGSNGAGLLELMPGSRAGALAGAYSAATSDTDVLFYNPAGLANVRRGAAFAYERLIEDMSLRSISGGVQLGRVVIAAGSAYFTSGEINALEPDPQFGGERGRETNQLVSANQSATYLAAALSLKDDRLRIGTNVGVVSTAVAEDQHSAVAFGVGGQFEVADWITVGAALRNVGGELSNNGGKLPTEARVGARAARRLSHLGAAVSIEYVSRMNESGGGLLAAIEAGIVPRVSNDGFGAFVRAGYEVEQADGGLAPLQLGGGLSLGRFALDYSFRDYNFFGAVHRVGLRWIVARSE